MNYPISSAMASFCTTTTVEEAMQTIRDAGFDSLDFPISVYSRPLNSPLRQDNWREWVKSVRKAADDLGLVLDCLLNEGIGRYNIGTRQHCMQRNGRTEA